MKGLTAFVFLSCCTVMINSSVGAQTTRIVPDDYATIQAAIDACFGGDTVLIRDGIWAGVGNRAISFEGKNIHVKSENGAATCTIDCENETRGIAFESGETSDAILEGITIINGNDDHGAGIFISQSSPTIKNIVVRNCHANLAAGALNCSMYSNPSISNCLFDSNTAQYCGGVEIDASCSATLTDCTITGNVATEGNTGGLDTGGTGTIFLRCTVTNNSSPTQGGGIYIGSGVHLVFTDCTITENTAPAGAGIQMYDSSMSFTHCIISGNTATESGGGVKIVNSSPVFHGCTFENNSAGLFGGALFISDASDPVIGGLAGSGNQFLNNSAVSGADIFIFSQPVTPIVCSHNSFSGYHLSSFYIATPGAFDLTACVSALVPLTGNVYVSSSGDDSRAGTTWSTAFKTLSKAMSQVYGTEDNPVRIHLAPGHYSSTLTGERFPIAPMDHVQIIGNQPEETVLDAENSHGILFFNYANGSFLTGITCTGGTGEQYNDIKNEGGAVFVSYSEMTIDRCIVTGNSAFRGAGIYCGNDSIISISNCTITENESEKRGGGLWVGRSRILLSNNIISANSSIDLGGGAYFINTLADILNCTITGNESLDGGAVFSDEGSTMNLINDILWNDLPNEIAGTGAITVAYSDIQGGYAGTGNIDSDPLFVSGPAGTYYLSQTDSGQSADSPCVNTGKAISSETCFDLLEIPVCMNMLTTRSDHKPDALMADIGYHSPMQTCSQLRVTIFMPSHHFTPGDACLCKVTVCNPETESYPGTLLFVALEAYGAFYFAPDFSSFDYYEIPLEFGSMEIVVLPEFAWPSGVGSADGLNWYAGMTDPDITHLVGEYDVFTFGWSE